ncbi:alkaline phosphatase family protein [Pseudoalteromonas obscura]|uniref:Alkaline phosphatase family protein n=1 Tax=Pseudoalteromonas obscura TaxID=3048491 RepID=A0ABT7EG64_9GAMM|nr:alkaline phosphatase family protein [Pseudoalteromonas sp. P94(2023)]MDK2593466.1 alkaline phosphatase family protein [Pseudoalteromonas sp. P94(2023)]
MTIKDKCGRGVIGAKKTVANLCVGLFGAMLSGQVLASSHSLLIAIDGLRGDGIENASTPNLDKLIAGTWAEGYQGAFAFYAQTMKDAAPNSGPNHVGIMTGVTAKKSGVTGNSDVHTGRYAQYPHYQSLLERHSASLNTAYLVTWSTDMQIANEADLKIDSNDAGNVNNALKIINGTYESNNWPKGTRPDSIFLFLDDVDGAGHACCFTASDTGYVDEIADVDRQIGILLDAIKARPNFAEEDWQIVMTSDHGGRGSSHGIHAADNYTIPFLVASKTAKQGYLSGIPKNYDAAPTVLAHHGLSVPSNMDGEVRGHSVQAQAPENIETDLITYLPFDGNYEDKSGNHVHAKVGGGSPEINSGGKFGQFVAINGSQEYLSLGSPAEMDFASARDFTLMTWYRVSGDQQGDPVIVGNKNWDSGSNRGTLLLANEGNGDDVGINIASTSADRKDIDPIDYTFNGWWLLVATFDRDGSATLYAGSPTGQLNIISGSIEDVGDISSSLDWNIGQDGTGTYKYNLKADLDDFAVWGRALTLDEVRALYNGGSGTEINKILNNAPTRYLNSNSSVTEGQDYQVIITAVANGQTCGLEWDATLRSRERNAKWDCAGRADPLTFQVNKVTTSGSVKKVSGYLVAQGGKGALEWDADSVSNERNAKFDEGTSGDYLTVTLQPNENETKISAIAYGRECGLEWDAKLSGGERNAKWDCHPRSDSVRIQLID